MCGRFTQAYTWRELYELYRLTCPPVNTQPRYNIAPPRQPDSSNKIEYYQRLHESEVHRQYKTVVLGAFSVPIDAQKFLLAPSSTEGAPSPECTIKGNVNSKGERIYHMEHQNSYGKIRMDKGGGRRWFCTPEEAEAAGWRRALR
jgi:hypothetical protein